MIRAETQTLNGMTFHLLVAGAMDAPLLLFLHGFPEYSGAWEEMLERLSDQFLCVAPDQRGYGQSAKPAGIEAYRTHHLVSDAAAILAAYAPRARAVVGHDWGASVAYALAIRHPGLMEKLVIANGAHPIPFQQALAAGGAQSAASQYINYLRDPRAAKRLSANHFAKLEAFFADGMDLSWLNGARLEAYRTAWRSPGALEAMLNWYRATPLVVAKPGEPLDPAALPVLDPARLRIRAPHLLIWGRADTALLPETTAGLDALCDDLSRQDFDDADHWIVHQKPDAVAALIREFCT